MAELYKDMQIMFVLDRLSATFLFKMMSLMTFLTLLLKNRILVEMLLLKFAVHKGIVDPSTFPDLRRGECSNQKPP